MIHSGRLRDALNAQRISQSELARRVGVTQQTIYKLVSGTTYGSKHIHKIARELDTTPAYLMGETDDPHADLPAPPDLDSDERLLIEAFSHLAPADRRALLQIARSMAGGAQPSGTVHGQGGGEGKAVTVHDKSSAYRGEEG